MNTDEAIDKALEGGLSNHEWQVLMSDPDTLKELEQQLGMDALLRVALEKNDTPAALADAIEASVNVSSIDDLMRSIEESTTRRRPRRFRPSSSSPTSRPALIPSRAPPGRPSPPRSWLRSRSCRRLRVRNR